MKISIASIFYFIGSAIFLMGAIWNIVNPTSLAVPYLWLICACCYATASTAQFICELLPRKETSKNDTKYDP